MNKLQQACREGNVTKALEAINAGWLKQREDAKPSLYIALERGHLMVAKLLIFCGANQHAVRTHALKASNPAVTNQLNTLTLSASDLVALLVNTISNGYTRAAHLLIEGCEQRSLPPHEFVLLHQAANPLRALAAACEQFTTVLLLKRLGAPSSSPANNLRSPLYWALRHDHPDTVTQLLADGVSMQEKLQTLQFLKADGQESAFQNFFQQVNKTEADLLKKLTYSSEEKNQLSTNPMLAPLEFDLYTAATHHDDFLLKEGLPLADTYQIFSYAFARQDFNAICQLLKKIPNEYILIKNAIGDKNWALLTLLASQGLNLYNIATHLLQHSPKHFTPFLMHTWSIAGVVETIFFHKDKNTLHKALSFWLDSQDEKLVDAHDPLSYLAIDKKIIVTNAFLRFIQDENSINLQPLLDVPIPGLNERVKTYFNKHGLDGLSRALLRTSCQEWGLYVEPELIMDTNVDVTHRLPEAVWKYKITSFLAPQDCANLATVSSRFFQLARAPAVEKINSYIKKIDALIQTSNYRRYGLGYISHLLITGGLITAIFFLIKENVRLTSQVDLLLAESKQIPGNTTSSCHSMYSHSSTGTSAQDFCLSPLSTATEACKALAALLCMLEQRQTGYVIGAIMTILLLLFTLCSLTNICSSDSRGNPTTYCVGSLSDAPFSQLPSNLRHPILRLTEQYDLNLTLDTPIHQVRAQLQTLAERLQRAPFAAIATEDELAMEVKPLLAHS